MQIDIESTFAISNSPKNRPKKFEKAKVRDTGNKKIQKFQIFMLSAKVFTESFLLPLDILLANWACAWVCNTVREKKSFEITFEML